MTATELADILAAWKLIEEYGLKYITKDWSADDYFGDSTLASVRSWAEAAGVPWNPPHVEGMYAAVNVDGISAYQGMLDAAEECGDGGVVFPCVVVMMKEGE